MGTKVTILEMADRLLLAEEMEISNLLKSKLSRRMDVYTGNLAEEVRGGDNQVTVIAKDIKTGKQREFSAQKMMMAVGRVSNADMLKVANTGFCGSDHSIMEAAGTPDGIILGHEVSATVVKCGSDVSGIDIGSRVMIRPTFCGACTGCLTGRTQL